jgi:hypothetical protein
VSRPTRRAVNCWFQIKLKRTGADYEVPFHIPIPVQQDTKFARDAYGVGCYIAIGDRDVQAAKCFLAYICPKPYMFWRRRVNICAKSARSKHQQPIHILPNGKRVFVIYKHVLLRAVTVEFDDSF